MPIPVLLAAAGVLNGPFTEPIDLVHATRLQLTPSLDGVISHEEWDPFSDQTFLQWEPGRIYLAGRIAEGRDLVLSLDGRSDGWLVGRDNLEFRISLREGRPEILVRELDATAVNQPVWRDRPELSAAARVNATADGGTINIEAVFADGGLNLLPRSPKSLKLRVDTVDPSVPTPPYLPRVCSDVRFDVYRSQSMPEQLRPGFQSPVRSVMPGEALKLRFTFEGNNDLGARSIELRSLGEVEDLTNKLALVFPTFDHKGRAFVDYGSRVDASAPAGYRIVRGTVNFRDGEPALVEASYRIAPPMEFLLIRSEFSGIPENNTLRVPYLLQSNLRKPAEGLLRVTPPEGWEVLRGDQMKFAVLGNRDAEKRTIEFRVPPDARGLYSFQISAETKEGIFEQTCMVTIR